MNAKLEITPWTLTEDKLSELDQMWLMNKRKLDHDERMFDYRTTLIQRADIDDHILFIQVFLYGKKVGIGAGVPIL